MDLKTRVVLFAEILVSDFDGAARTMFQLIKRIPKDKFEFLFVCGTGPDRLEGFEVLKLRTFKIPFNESYRIVSPFVEKKKLTKKILEFNPDVIHIATPSFLGHFGKKFAQDNHLPILSIYHTHFKSYIPYYFRLIPFMIKPAMKWAVKTTNAFYNAANVVYFPSESLAQEMKIDGLQEDKVKIWKRGIDRRLFNPEKKDKDKLRSLVGNERPTILFASRLVMEKNLQVLFDLYKLTEAEGYNILVVGEGVAKEEAQTNMPNAIFTGHLNHYELSVLYASADVFFFPSVTETFGNVVLEAMASGAACVISDQGGPKDFVQNGYSGFLCSAYDAEAYMIKIKEIIEDPSLKTKLSENARAFTAHFDWDYLANEYFEDLKVLK